jgi:hypothetical protein
MPTPVATTITPERKVWTKPVLASASIKEITGFFFGSGTDGGTMSGRMMMLSDARLKRRIREAGTSAMGLPIHTFEFVWGGPRYRGVLAQDLKERLAPAVVLDPVGFYRVNYQLIDVDLTIVDAVAARGGTGARSPADPPDERACAGRAFESPSP